MWGRFLGHLLWVCSNSPVCVSLRAARPSAASDWAGTAGCWGLTSCLRLHSRWRSQSSAATACVPKRPERWGGGEWESVSSATLTPPPETDACAPQLALWGRKSDAFFNCVIQSRLLSLYPWGSESRALWDDFQPDTRSSVNENALWVKANLSLGSQLVKTVRSLLSLMLSQGMSSSSADRDMAFTLSSRLNTLRQTHKHKHTESTLEKQILPS